MITSATLRYLNSSILQCVAESIRGYAYGISATTGLLQQLDERTRCNSIALCQGWNAKVVAHMCQKAVSKKLGDSQSVMRPASYVCSSVLLNLSNSSRSRMETFVVIHGEHASAAQ